MAALAVVGATGAAALAAAGAGVRSAAQARRAHEVAALAEERLARLAIATEAELRRLPDTLAMGRFDAPFDELSWRTTVTPDPAMAGLFAVRLELQWPGGSFTAHSAAYRPAASADEEQP